MLARTSCRNAKAVPPNRATRSRSLAALFLACANLPALAADGATTGILADLSRADRITPEQPAPSLIARLETLVEEGKEGARAAVDFNEAAMPYQTERTLTKDYLPYYPYYALKGSARHVVHPMALGRFIKANSKSEAAAKIIEAALGIAHRLPNGGLAWYHPRHYRVNRMLGEKLKYSSLAQGTLLAGFTVASRDNNQISMTHAAQTYKAMEWPFEKGGVNLAGRVVLEMPSFDGPPEIILNGWIDALLHVRAYARAARDEQALGFFRENVRFLARILPHFDAPADGLSRYSDVSPYKVKITLGTAEDAGGLEVLYRPELPELKPIRVPLASPENAKGLSIYENHITRISGTTVSAWLSCSQLYETVLLAKSSVLGVELDTGVVNRRQSSPGSGGQTLRLEGQALDPARKFVAFGPKSGLICGYPTNFSKGGTTNYYHVYHVIGLMLLAMGGDVELIEQRALLDWAFKWRRDMAKMEKEEGLPFQDPEDLLKRTNESLAGVEFESFQALNSAAEQRAAEMN